MLSRFFSAVPGAVKGSINFTELFRTIVTAFGASSLVGLALAVIAAVSADAAQIFPDPALAMAVTFGLAQVGDSLRRLDHGSSGIATVTLDGIQFGPKVNSDPARSATLIYRGTPVDPPPVSASFQPPFESLPR